MIIVAKIFIALVALVISAAGGSLFARDDHDGFGCLLIAFIALMILVFMP